MFATPKRNGHSPAKPGARTLDWELQLKANDQATTAFPNRAQQVYDLGYVYDPSSTPLLYQPDRRTNKVSLLARFELHALHATQPV